MNTDISDIKRSLIKKMISRGIIGHHHIRLETLLRCGWKPHEKHLVKEVIYDFIREGIIVWVKKSKKALTLNKDKIRQIELQFAEGE